MSRMYNKLSLFICSCVDFWIFNRLLCELINVWHLHQWLNCCCGCFSRIAFQTYYLNYYLYILGLALITMNEALLWTDGRYFLQATEELSDQWKLMRGGEDPSVDIWMADVSPLWNLSYIYVSVFSTYTYRDAIVSGELLWFPSFLCLCWQLA